MGVTIATDKHEVAYQDLCALVAKHAEEMTPLELLAVAANMVGKLVAMQDQRVVTVEHAMATVHANIEYGNQQVIEQLSKSAGNS